MNVVPPPAEPVAPPETITAPPAGQLGAAESPLMPAAPEALPAPSKIPAYILWGGAGVGLIIGTIYGISAISAKSDFDDDPTYAKGDSVHNRSIVSDVGFGAGLVLGITGTIFYLIADKPPATEQAPPVAATTKRSAARLSAGPGGGAFSLSF